MTVGSTHGPGPRTIQSEPSHGESLGLCKSQGSIVGKRLNDSPGEPKLPTIYKWLAVEKSDDEPNLYIGNGGCFTKDPFINGWPWGSRLLPSWWLGFNPFEKSAQVKNGYLIFPK